MGVIVKDPSQKIMVGWVERSENQQLSNSGFRLMPQSTLRSFNFRDDGLDFISETVFVRRGKGIP